MGHTKEDLENRSKPVKCAAWVQGLPVYGGDQVTVIDFVGATGGKSNGRDGKSTW